MDNKKSIFIIVIVLILIVGGIGFWYWSQKKTGTLVGIPIPIETPQAKGAVGTAKTISESVPEIQTNTGENVPEVNPLDRTNPFKYINPLR
ncbi:MAG: hypothetical protein AAB944_01015 [Patescibacteria group bacterium]